MTLMTTSANETRRSHSRRLKCGGHGLWCLLALLAHCPPSTASLPVSPDPPDAPSLSLSLSKYDDNYEILDRPRSRSLAGNNCQTSQSVLTLHLTTDDSPSDTSWKLIRLDSVYYDLYLDPTNSKYASVAQQTGSQRSGTVLARGPPEGEAYDARTRYAGSTCLDGGYVYVVRVEDATGDGLGDDGGGGGFRIEVEGDPEVVAPGNPTREAEGEIAWEAFGTDVAGFRVKDFEFVVHPIENTDDDNDNNNSNNRPSPRPSRRPSPRPSSRRPTNRPTAQQSTGYQTAVSFIVMGDVPYYTNHRYCLNKQLRQLDSQSQDFFFLVHVGDIKSGQTKNCEKEIYSDVAEIVAHPRNALRYDPRDFFFLIGDNDWSDCDDPDEALSHWMNHFGNGGKTNGINTGRNPHGFGTLSDPNIDVEYDYRGNNAASRVYPSSATNFSFFHNRVLFVGINQVGGGYLGDEAERVANNFEWVKENMAYYKSRGLRTVVVFAHASMEAAREKYFGAPFMRLLRNSYPNVLALYFHGDGHEFEVGYVDSNNRNLIQVQVDSGDIADPILVSIDRDSSRSRDKMVIDRRGGRYKNGDCDPGQRDKTWSSNSW